MRPPSALFALSALLAGLATLGAPAVAHGATAPVRAPIPIVLPRALPITDAASSTLFSARLAIARAQQISPQAAQTAAFQYTAAVQQYRSGNFAGARRSALQALATAGSAQVPSSATVALPAPPIVAAPPQLPGLAGGLYGADAAAVDADAFLALARGMIEDCGARRDSRLGAAKKAYAQAQQDFARRDWQATRLDAKAAIDACAKPQP